MTTVANQKVITVAKEKSNKENLYAIFNLNAMQHAMIDLKPSGLKLWMYINKNQDGHTFALSAVDAVKWGVGSRKSYDNAVKELQEKGYLVNKSGNHFDFYELPKAEEIKVTVNKCDAEFSF